ncbi:flavin-containing monooxygenase [Marinomonas posidonica]|uniref:flavin-containing monooxygenase n=1 Tax=Marinomonas posidonica TaxID=936476 RepID=UPI001C0A88A5|nr:NAD(P)/FAD-dependent oxidoreductase [Marinomonas posidonica]
MTKLKLDNTVVDTLVIGAGQAGIATSEHLTALNVPHIVVEKDRIAERWRSQRWDSLVANGPAWHDRFPNLQFEELDPDAFPSKERVARYFEEYVEKFSLPVYTDVTVKQVSTLQGEAGYAIETSKGCIKAKRIVCATGPFQKPSIPPIVPELTNLKQLHSSHYFNPEQLDSGAVLVVGAGSSGVQIADEINRSGKKVYLSVGPHDRPPRSYRGRDFVWWLGVLGKWDAPAAAPDAEHVTIAVSGAHKGITIDFRELANNNITLLGRTHAFTNGTLSFSNDLVQNIEKGDENYLSLLEEADAYIEKNGLDLPEEPSAKRILPQPECMLNPIRELDLAASGITTIIWATGFKSDYSWLDLDVFDDKGAPQHQRGVTALSGIYFVGLPWLSRRGSSFIWGCWHDAKYIADHIETQRKYHEYECHVPEPSVEIA